MFHVLGKKAFFAWHFNIDTVAYQFANHNRREDSTESSLDLVQKMGRSPGQMVRIHNGQLREGLCDGCYLAT